MLDSKKTIIAEVPIFPLPNTVFFPKTLLPLHVFEPRYRNMVKNARANENLIGMVLLKKGWENDYFGNPSVHNIASVGEIQYTEKLVDGKYNIMLYGVSRVKILEFTQDTPYRIARVKYLRDLNFDQDGFNEPYEMESLIGLIRNYLGEMGLDDLEDLLELQSQSLESIINHAATILDFSIGEKQSLLEMNTLHHRYDKLIKLLKDKLTMMRIAKYVKIVPEDPSLN